MRGFTLVELLIAMAVTLIVTAATLSLVGPAHDAFQVQPEMSDLHQRTRVGIDALHRDLLMAGAGMYAAGAVGPLHQFLAPVMPYRAFGAASDPAAGIFFRSDALSLLFVPSTPSQSTLAVSMPTGALEMTIENPATCPPATTTQLCGLGPGDQVLVFSPSGEWDVFTVDRAGTGITVKGLPPEHDFAAGSNVVAARAVTYGLKPDPATGAFQLIRSDGFDRAQPLLDHVVKLEFHYWGDAEPPRIVDDAGMSPRASYGPTPPPVDQAALAWPVGENCTFAIVDGQHRTRLPTLVADGSVVELAPAILTDGPWCPDTVARNRFDADLLRIRRVRVTLRVQTALPSLRGPMGRLFTNGGLARAAGRMVPDLELQFDVAPRNLNLELGTRNLEHE